MVNVIFFTKLTVLRQEKGVLISAELWIVIFRETRRQLHTGMLNLRTY